MSNMFKKHGKCESKPKDSKRSLIFNVNSFHMPLVHRLKYSLWITTAFRVVPLNLKIVSVPLVVRISNFLYHPVLTKLSGRRAS